MVDKRKKAGYGDRRWETEPGGRRLETVDEREEMRDRKCETRDERQEMCDRRHRQVEWERRHWTRGVRQEAWEGDLRHEI